MNRGHFKRYHELSRTTRYRIRQAMQREPYGDNSSSDDEVPEPVPKRRRIEIPRRGALPRREEAANVSSDEDPQNPGDNIPNDAHGENQQNPIIGDQAQDHNALNLGDAADSDGPDPAREPEQVVDAEVHENVLVRDNDNNASADEVSSAHEQDGDIEHGEAEPGGIEGDESHNSGEETGSDGDNGENEGNNSHDSGEDTGPDGDNGENEGEDSAGEETDPDGDNGENEGEDNPGEDTDPEREFEDVGWDRDDNDLLYEGAPIRVGESMLAILSFVLRHNLSGSCISDLLALVALHCKPEANHCRKTLFRFKKFFENINFPLKKRYYCSACHSNIDNENEDCPECRRDFGKSFFIEVPILSQLKSLYKRAGFRESLGRRFTRRKKNDANYEDIYDGAIYKELSERGGILSDPNNISLLWYTDGVSIFKSAKYEIWPFYLTINELPYNKRTMLPNALLAGLWFGNKKPAANTFLNYMRHDLQRLRNGIRCHTAVPQQPIVVRGIVIGGTCDLPARAKFLNFKQYNSVHGCPRCLIETMRLGPGQTVYPSGGNIRLRTDEETLRQATEAIQLPLYRGDRQAVMGVMGPTALSTFVYQCVRTTSVDGMHCLFLGVVRSLLVLWFEQDNHNEPYSLREYMDLIDHRLTLITPPSFVNRLTRSLKDMKYWKAHEYKLFLFYYSLAVLKGIMPAIYYDHHVLLVHATYILCQASISLEMVQQADEMLTEYVAQYEVLYNLENMTCNLHSLRHLADTVRNFGPLWVTSCFPYEDLNGKLKKLVTGPRYAELQVCTGVSMFFKLVELKENLREGEVLEFCNQLTNRHQKHKKTRIEESLWILGTIRKVDVLEGVRLEALNASNIIGTNFFSFQRLLKYNVVFTSELYERATKTDSKCVKYLHDNNAAIGMVHSYIRVTDCQCQQFCADCDPKYYAIIRKCVTQPVQSSWPDSRLYFMHKLVRIGRVYAVELSLIQNICFVVKIADRNDTFIIETVNLVEPE